MCFGNRSPTTGENNMPLLVTEFALFSNFALDRGSNISAGSGWSVSSTHASSQDGRVLPALPAGRRLVAEWGVRGSQAGFKEQVVRSLVAESVGVLAPRPHVGIFDRLSRELRLECLGSRQD